jgi:hypothetical protein
MVALKGRGPEREPAIRSVLRAVILIVLGDVSEQRVARLLCRCKIIHLVGLRRSLVSLVPHLKRRAVLRSRFPPVIEPGGGNIRMPEPLLHLGDVGLMVECVGRGRGPQ